MEFHKIRRRQFGIAVVLPASWELDTLSRYLCDDKKTPCEVFFSEDSASDVTLGFSVKSLDQCYQEALAPTREQRQDQKRQDQKRRIRYFPIRHTRQSDRFLAEYRVLVTDYASRRVRGRSEHHVQYYYWNKNLRKVVFAKFKTVSLTHEKATVALFEQIARSIELI